MCEPPLSQFAAGLHPALLKMQELSDPFQPKPLHVSSGANAKTSCPYQGLQVRAKQEPCGDKSATHHLENTAHNTLRAANSSAAPRDPNPRHLHSQWQSTAGTNSRKRKQMLQRYASVQSDSDLNFTPAFASLHRVWFQALFAIVQEVPLWEATQMWERIKAKITTAASAETSEINKGAGETTLSLIEN